MNGCAPSCEKTNTCWYTGACTLTGDEQAHTHIQRCSSTNRPVHLLMSAITYSTVMTVGCPQVTSKERLKSHHVQKSRGGLVQQHTCKKNNPELVHQAPHGSVIFKYLTHSCNCHSYSNINLNLNPKFVLIGIWSHDVVHVTCLMRYPGMHHTNVVCVVSRSMPAGCWTQMFSMSG